MVFNRAASWKGLDSRQRSKEKEWGQRFDKVEGCFDYDFFQFRRGLYAPPRIIHTSALDISVGRFPVSL